MEKSDISDIRLDSRRENITNTNPRAEDKTDILDMKRRILSVDYGFWWF
jgi:hypothetical protein